MLTNEQIESYFESGYLLVEDVVTPEQLQLMQDITHEFIDRARHVTKSNDIYDLDVGHNSDTPKLTWIKLPHKQHPFLAEVLKNSGITEVLRRLVGANAVLQTSKLNAKAPGGGLPSSSIRTGPFIPIQMTTCWPLASFWKMSTRQMARFRLFRVATKDRF